MLKAIYSKHSDITRLCHPDCDITCLECVFLKDIFKNHAAAWNGKIVAVQGHMTEDEKATLDRVFKGDIEYDDQE